MIYVLIIATLIIINFTNIISKIQKKEYVSNAENYVLNNYKLIFGTIFLIFFIAFWRYSCFFLGFNC
jgi:hypothetical protein